MVILTVEALVHARPVGGTFSGETLEVAHHGRQRLGSDRKDIGAPLVGRLAAWHWKSSIYGWIRSTCGHS